MNREIMRGLFIASGFNPVEEHIDDMFKTYILVEAMIKSSKEAGEAGARAGLKVKNMLAEEDPEAWREEYRKKQAAGVKFERRRSGGEWMAPTNYFDFSGNKEDYREVQEASGKEPEWLVSWQYRVKPKTVKCYIEEREVEA